MINYLIFDIGGVIIYAPKMDWEAQDRRLGLEIGTVKKIIDDCFRKRSLDSKFDETAYFVKTYAGILSWETYQCILAEFYASERPNYELITWIRSQKPKRKTFALTNNTVALNGLLREKFKIGDLFDGVFNSAEIGLAKPDPKLFQYILGRMNISAEECLFIDDNSKNTDAAAVLGFKIIIFTNNVDFKLHISQLGL